MEFLCLAFYCDVGYGTGDFGHASSVLKCCGMWYLVVEEGIGVPLMVSFLFVLDLDSRF